MEMVMGFYALLLLLLVGVGGGIYFGFKITLATFIIKCIVTFFVALIVFLDKKYDLAEFAENNFGLNKFVLYDDLFVFEIVAVPTVITTWLITIAVYMFKSFSV